MTELNPSMKLVDMKKVLAQGRTRSLNCAYGGAKTGMALLLDVKRQGRVLQTELQTTQGNLQAPAFGTALFDEKEVNHLKFRVNKGVEGHAKRLAKTLHGTGVKRVTILFDGDALFESADVEAEAVAASQAAPPLAQQPPRPPASPQEVTAELGRVAGLLQGSQLPPPDKIAGANKLRAAKVALAAGQLEDAGSMIADVARSLADRAPPQPATQTPAAPPQRPAAATPPTSPATQALNDALRVASIDIKEAQSIPDRFNALAADKQALAAALVQLRAQRDAGDHAGAMASVAAARKAAITVKGKANQLAGQQQIYDGMAKPLERVRNTYFTKANNDNLRREKLKPGAEFRDHLAALDEWDKNPRLDVLDEIESTAKAYLAHNAQLGMLARGTKESKRKKEVCETALTQARHMRMALEMEQAGPPPWDDSKALKAASIRAAFGFEMMGEKAGMLPSGDGGVSAAFWVKGWDDSSGNADTSKKDFLFKPAKGEEAVRGFAAGGSTPREAVAKALADKIGIMTGLDLGVPPTSVVSLSPDSIDLASYNDGIRDVAGKRPIDPTVAPVGSLQQFAASSGSLSGKDAAFLATIPQSECEKMGVLDILCLNTDRHPGNFMLTEQDGPAGKQPKLIPIDHGLSLPSRDGMRKRGAERINDVDGNVLLKMPGSHQAFSADMQQRIGMLDPDEIERGINTTIDAVDQAHPDLKTKTHLPPDAAFLAKRSARFLKRACGRLSPALVQIALANHQTEIFDSADTAFDAQADTVITVYEAQAAAIKEMYVDLGTTKEIMPKLRELGWHDLNRDFASDETPFKAWFATNATVAMAAFRNNTPWPGQPPKPVS